MRAMLQALIIVFLCWIHPARAYVGSDSPWVRIPCEKVRDMIYVRTSVNGSAPVWMNLDTGASRSVIDPRLARALGLKETNSGEASGIGQGQNARFGRVEGTTLQIGKCILRNESILTLSLSFLASQLGHATDGTLGSNIFANYVVRVDYVRTQVGLEKPTLSNPDHADAALPIELRSNMPFVTASIAMPDGREVTGIFLIDSGQIGAALSLNEAFQKAHPELLAQGAIDAPAVEAVGGSFTYRITRVRALKIGRFVFKDPITVLPLHAAGIEADPNVAGVIGADVLSRFNVIYDYPHRRVFLSPNAQFSRPFETDMSGLRLRARPPGFKEFQVSGIARTSPASEAGLRDGDIITAVDGRPASALTLGQVQESLERAGEFRQLNIQRGKQEFRFTLHLRRLI